MEGRSLFLPKHWNLSVRPWQCVEIRLNSQEEDTDSDSEYGSVKPYGQFGGPLSPPDTAAKQGTAGAHATLESAMIPAKYRIDFHSKPRYAGQQETFLYSRTWDTPVVIRSSNLNGESDHVLEEIHHVSFGTSRGAWKKDGVNVSDPSLILNGIFPFPFKELYHHREELLEYQNGSSSARSNHTLEDNEKCDRHIGVLLDYLDKEPTVQLQSVKSLWAQKVPTTTFAGFWLLLKPGSDVYITEYGQLNACVLDMVYGGMEYSSRTVRANDYEIHVWYLVFDGKVIKRKSKVIDVPVFDGEREIMSLPIFPTYFRDQLDGGSLRRTLIERGEKVFCYAKGPTFLEYSGSGLKQGTKKSLIVDILDVNGLSEPTLAENAIDELVMRPEKNKEMIKAIVKTYTDSDSQAELMGVDFIRGKGEGQIFLLHGPPGTGKTLTAGRVYRSSLDLL
ncbi:hypothetical protein J4E89_004872 [Alternaria sp. Ai002NY15]|nr:hypothetical protein J4E89_004872 [Alternaria sp. Ai002NY15]